MCGRFSLGTCAAELAELFQLAEVPTWTPRYNIAPTQDVLTILWTPDRPESHFALRRWGLIPPWAEGPAVGSRLINGLAETRRAEREATLRKAFGATPERFVRGVPTPPVLPQAVWINKPRILEDHDRLSIAVEPGERVARPTEWRSALAGRSLDGEIASTVPANEEERELIVVH